MALSEKLQMKINETVALAEDYKLPPALKFLSENVGCKVAPLSWGSSVEELKLYPTLQLEAQHNYGNVAQQEEYMCELILPYVHGKSLQKSRSIIGYMNIERFIRNIKDKKVEVKNRSIAGIEPAPLIRKRSSLL